VEDAIVTISDQYYPARRALNFFGLAQDPEVGSDGEKVGYSDCNGYYAVPAHHGKMKNTKRVP
jgi:hypothetical protein